MKRRGEFHLNVVYTVYRLKYSVVNSSSGETASVLSSGAKLQPIDFRIRQTSYILILHNAGNNIVSECCEVHSYEVDVRGRTFITVTFSFTSILMHCEITVSGKFY
jgi:hypothetical protein